MHFSGENDTFTANDGRYDTLAQTCNVEAADGLSGIRPWDETRCRVAGGWPKRDLALETPGWRFYECNQL